jgi:hypothetical protein
MSWRGGREDFELMEILFETLTTPISVVLDVCESTCWYFSTTCDVIGSLHNKY